ncbi:hypothetical protein LTR78_001285 [Recurvomyces mirabilis]|uniref:Major facilitator superfamily (MFS) profile domain-containing protein n=1 Tax=Recurvomyces mirabilis TaxID=574656 RepID=A0AAE0WV48_9PEZI|nr:hypothetical protein LTR78_001285 [Recurvomyces mirabilis]KAK5161262.1 hypothetical protein LTS14_001058 [Recurvomyces mirabilis]
MALLEGNALLYSVSLLACLGFLLIGFDNGLMGGLVNGEAFDNTFHINPKSKSGANLIGLIVSIYEIGCFIGAVTTAFVGERLGRRRSIFAGTVVMIIGAVLQATSYSVAQMIVARIVAGIGMGFINSTVPVMMAEFAPKATRGIYVCAQLSTLNFGIMMVYWIDYGFGQGTGAGQPYSWRVPVILQCIFLIPMLIIIALIPETPRWLTSHGREEEALEVLRRLNRKKMSDAAIIRIVDDIRNVAAYEASIDSGKWSDLLRNDSIQSQKRFLIACSIQAFQQLGGINALVYYSNTLFQQSVGFTPQFSALMSGILNTWFFVASFIPWFLIDRIGRRPLLLSMVSLMAGVMAVQTGLIYSVQNNLPNQHACGAAAAAMLFIFQGAFTVGFQATVWVYPSEILPLKLRQRGSSISTACNWIMNFMIVYITPPAIQNIGYKTYIIFAVLNATWVPIMYFYYPETKGLALEDVDRLFAKNGEMQEHLAYHDDKLGDVENRVEGDEKTMRVQ